MRPMLSPPQLLSVQGHLGGVPIQQCIAPQCCKAERDHLETLFVSLAGASDPDLLSTAIRGQKDVAILTFSSFLCFNPSISEAVIQPGLQVRLFHLHSNAQPPEDRPINLPSSSPTHLH